MKPLFLAFAAALALTPACHAAVQKPRLIVATDIGSEPDDAESMVRLLLYANDIEGLIASTSTWQRTEVHPELIVERVDAYGKVVGNLRKHASGYPDASALRSRILSGRAVYGMSGVGKGLDTKASDAIIAAVDRPDARPVWVAIWGGAVDLAQALWHVRDTRSPEQLAAFVAKLRVYAISDQDDAGPWIRREFPDLFWVGSIHAFNNYTLATWYGISGDLLTPTEGPDTALVTNDWGDKHLRLGALGALYLRHLYIMEGDTPSFLNLIGNGLSDPEHPEFGGWGGRYAKVTAADGLYTDTADRVAGIDGKVRQTNQATIWRWRQAYQDDFAARIQWSLTDSFAKANHAPHPVLDGVAGLGPIRLSAHAGEVVHLSAAGSKDPDGDRLRYNWWIYGEAGGQSSRAKPPVLDGANTAEAALEIPAGPARSMHVILEVWDDGAPAMVTYRRAIIDVTP